MSEFIKVYPDANTRSAGLAEAERRIEAYLNNIDPEKITTRAGRASYKRNVKRLEHIREVLRRLQGKIKLK